MWQFMDWDATKYYMDRREAEVHILFVGDGPETATWPEVQLVECLFEKRRLVKDFNTPI